MSSLAADHDREVCAAAMAVSDLYKKVPVRMAGSTGRATSDSLGSQQQLYDAADAAKEAAEADNLLDPQDLDRFTVQHRRFAGPWVGPGAVPGPMSGQCKQRAFVKPWRQGPLQIEGWPTSAAWEMATAHDAIAAKKPVDTFHYLVDANTGYPAQAAERGGERQAAEGAGRGKEAVEASPAGRPGKAEQCAHAIMSMASHLARCCYVYLAR
jgi:hypothetical protein